MPNPQCLSDILGPYGSTRLALTLILMTGLVAACDDDDVERGAADAGSTDTSPADTSVLDTSPADGVDAARPPGCVGPDTCAAGKICRGGACVPVEGCLRDVECGPGEYCADGRCVPTPRCAHDDECPVGHGCDDGFCVWDGRVRCAGHAECAPLSRVCRIEPDAALGDCVDHAAVPCEAPADCVFGGGEGEPTLVYVCDAGACRAPLLDLCFVDDDCVTGLDCQLVGGSSRCLAPCAEHADCDPRMRCEPNLGNHCNWNLCGDGPTELSGGFANIRNGRLGGACRADAPEPAPATECARDADCAGTARCHTGEGRCETLCTEPADCGGWRTCRPAAVGAGGPCADDGDCGPAARCLGGELGARQCTSINGVCEPLLADGRCVEVEAGPGEWVGLCFEGGRRHAGEPCLFGAARRNDDAGCAGGLVCVGAGADDGVHGVCRPTCAAGGHGEMSCPDDGEARACVAIEGSLGACLAPAERCDPAAAESCGDAARCTFGGWLESSGACVARAPEDRRREVGERCGDTIECPDGAVCLGEPRTCLALCRPRESGRCLFPTSCVAIAELTGNQIAGSSYGLCWSQP